MGLNGFFVGEHVVEYVKSLTLVNVVFFLKYTEEGMKSKEN